MTWWRTARLKELRAEARRRAVMAAREEAALYGDASGVGVGPVMALEDVDPEPLSGRWEGHTLREPTPADDAGEPGAIDPGSITIRAAVDVLYRIEAGK